MTLEENTTGPIVLNTVPEESQRVPRALWSLVIARMERKALANVSQSIISWTGGLEKARSHARCGHWWTIRNHGEHDKNNHDDARENVEYVKKSKCGKHKNPASFHSGRGRT